MTAMRICSAKKQMAASGQTVRRYKTVARYLVLVTFLICMIATSGAAHAEVTILRHVTLVDGTGSAPRHDVSLIIENGRVRTIAGAHSPRIAGAKVIGLGGKTIMPELINTHGHLGLLKGTKMSSANYTLDNVRRQLLQYQSFGVGAVLVMGTDNDEAYAWRSKSQAGALPGALLYTAGRGFGVPQGLPPAAMGVDAVYRPATPGEARRDVQELATHKPDVVKIWVDDFWGQFPKMKPEIYAAIIDEAHKQHLRVAAHVYHEADAQRLVDLGVNILAHSVRDAELPDSLVAEMKRKHVACIGTLSLDEFATAYADDPAWLSDPYFRASLEPGVYEMITNPKYKQSIAADRKTADETAALPIALKNFKKLYDAGILVALGTDSGATPIRPFGFSEHMELRLLVRAGLTPLQAITVGTRNGAELLGASHEIGTLTPGHAANFIVLDKDPTLDIRNTETIAAVWKNGRQVSTGPIAHR